VTTETLLLESHPPTELVTAATSKCNFLLVHYVTIISLKSLKLYCTQEIIVSFIPFLSHFERQPTFLLYSYMKKDSSYIGAASVWY
jgi:hypothetical protein